MINVTAFQAIDGDCIWLRYGPEEKTNVLIDLGRLGSYKTSIKKVSDICIQQDEAIDLLVLTHVDSDHISGVSAMIHQESLLSNIKTVMFNSPGLEIQDVSSGNISYKEGTQAYRFFQRNEITMMQGIANGSDPLLLKGASITILSPTESILAEYYQKWEESDNISARESDWHCAIEELLCRPEKTDRSLNNNASIAFLFEFAQKKALFLGDSSPTIICSNLSQMGFDKNNPLEVDMVKLSHHGSDYNLSKEWLGLIRCKRFLISSNGHNLSKRALSKIVVANFQNNLDETIFYFNYDESVYGGLFTKEELDRYNIQCVYGDDSLKGVELNL